MVVIGKRPLFQVYTWNFMPPQAWADQLAQASIALYNSLPKHGKPTVRSNGVPEWTILAVISLAVQEEEGPSLRAIPISLGTGAKCLPANKLPPLGDTLHDCHAEVLARRGLVRWLLEEGKRVVAGEDHLDVLEPEAGQFRLKPSVQVWMYVSALPCGDASTLHTALHQPADMAALKDGPRLTDAAPASGDIAEGSGSGAGTVRGRNGYATFSAIRTKPGRADSVPSISMSCSDKIATWSAVGLQGALLSELFVPIKLSGIVVGGVEPTAEFVNRSDEFEDMILGEADRALWGRLQPIEDRLPEPYSLSRPVVYFTPVRYKHHKSDVAAAFRDGPEPSTSPTSISFIRTATSNSNTSVDVIFNGSKLGTNWKAPGEVVLAPRGRSQVCKLEIFKAYAALRASMSAQHSMLGLNLGQTYYELKHPSGAAYQRAKAVLRGHVLAERDLPAFSRCGRFAITGRTEAETTLAEPSEDLAPPFSGWIVSGYRWESFTFDGQLLRGQSLANNGHR